MKKVVFSIFLLLSNNAFSQDQKIMLQHIDSLKALKIEYENKIMQINTAIKEIENKKTIIEFEQFDNLKYVIPAQPTVRIREKENSSGKLLFEPKKGEIITLIDFDDNTHHWLVSFHNTVGYVNEVLIRQNSDVDDFKKYLAAKKIQKIEENKRLATENARRAEEIRKVEAQKLEEKRNLEAQKQIEESKKLVSEAEKNQRIRNAALIKKYGSTIADKIITGKIWIGMTDEMALESWGKPEKNNRSVGSWGVHEQWIYHNDVYVYFENGILTSWQDEK
jgi:hypothetical protein